MVKLQKAMPTKFKVNMIAYENLKNEEHK